MGGEQLLNSDKVSGHPQGGWHFQAASSSSPLRKREEPMDQGTGEQEKEKPAYKGWCGRKLRAPDCGIILFKKKKKKLQEHHFVAP